MFWRRKAKASSEQAPPQPEISVPEVQEVRPAIIEHLRGSYGSVSNLEMLGAFDPEQEDGFAAMVLTRFNIDIDGQDNREGVAAFYFLPGSSEVHLCGVISTPPVETPAVEDDESLPTEAVEAEVRTILGMKVAERVD